MYKSESPPPRKTASAVAAKVTMEKRVYQVWKGNNRFFLGGRLIFGPDVHSLFMTLVLIVAPSVVFCIFIVNHLTGDLDYVTRVTIMCGAALYIFCVVMVLLVTSSRDPGIIPRNEHPPEPEDDYDAARFSSDSGGQTPRTRLPRTKDVIVNGVSVKVKYCDTCMLYRPPRCSHCSICNNCVDRFDHHCPWVGQCIGRRNYPFFFMFIASTTVLCIAVFSTSAIYIKKLMMDVTPNRSVWQALAKSPAAIFLMVYTFIAVWFVGGLTLFHLYLVSSNQTTYENFRYRYDNRVNPYDRGVASNLKGILCSGIPASRNRFRDKVKDANVGVGMGNWQARERNNMTAPSSRIAKAASADIEMGGKPKWGPVAGGEGWQHLRGNKNNDTDMKEGYKDNFVSATSPLGSKLWEDIKISSHRAHSRWEHRNESAEITPDNLAYGAMNSEGYRLTGDCTPPGNR